MITAHENAHPAIREVATRANAAGLGVTRLAKKAGVSQGGLSELFSARKKEPGLDTLAKLAAAMGCTRSDLLGESGLGMTVPWERLMEVDNPRKVMDDAALEDLAGSIAAQGVLQPLLVRRGAGGFYVIIAGHRRFRAIKMLGDPDFPVPVIVREDDGAARLLTALAENIQRADMHPLDEAEAFRDLNTVWGMATDDIAGHVQRSRRHVQKRIQIADGLIETARDEFRQSRFTLAVAEALSEADAAIQEQALERILDGLMERTEADVRHLIRGLGGGKTGSSAVKPEAAQPETWPVPGEGGRFSDCPQAVDFDLNIDGCDLAILYIQTGDAEWRSGYRLYWDNGGGSHRPLTTANPVWDTKADAVTAAWADVADRATDALITFGDNPATTRAAREVIHLCEGALGRPVELPDGTERPVDPDPDLGPEPGDEESRAALSEETMPKETWNDDSGWDCPWCGAENIPPEVTVGGAIRAAEARAGCRTCGKYSMIVTDVSWKATPC